MKITGCKNPSISMVGCHSFIFILRCISVCCNLLCTETLMQGEMCRIPACLSFGIPCFPIINTFFITIPLKKENERKKGRRRKKKSRRWLTYFV